MSLNWSVQRVKYFKDNPDAIWQKFSDDFHGEYEDLNTVTKSLVFGTMAVGIGELSYKNLPEYYARWKFYEKYADFSVYSTFKDGESIETYLNPEMLLQHMGLSTNVGEEKESEWIKRIEKREKMDFNAKRKDYLLTAGDIKKELNKFKQEFENYFLAETDEEYDVEEYDEDGE